ncbi:MAG: hypothetical protein OHK0013_44120 [Sandaracinaceae bacterium]
MRRVPSLRLSTFALRASLAALAWIGAGGCSLALRNDFRFAEDDAAPDATGLDGGAADAGPTDARADDGGPDARTDGGFGPDGGPAECRAAEDCAARPFATAACDGGACVYTCEAGRDDCNGDPEDGCETDLASDEASCGRCGEACAAVGAIGVCEAGRCRLDCVAGRADCDGSPGCETALGTPTDCGACDDACGAGQTCDSALTPPRCASSCSGTECGASCVDLMTSTQHCGACDRPCTGGSAFWACEAGSCAITACEIGSGDCDGTAMNGCETNLRTTVEHCGSCGAACMLANATPACEEGRCRVARCNVGFDNCNGLSTDGCEIDLRTDAAHCGACGMRCELANATSACSAGNCIVTACEPGYDDCDRAPGNGCEVNVLTSPSHCGGCGMACTLANATSACAAGRCAIASCSAGFLDCDGNPANGCELPVASLETSTAHCGTCGNACDVGEACIAGVCDPVRDVAGGEHNGCAVRESGRVYCWGINDAGQLANATLLPTGPQRIPGLTASQVSVGSSVAYAIERGTGRLLAWGRGLDGELAHGVSGNRSTPAPIEEDDAGADFSLPFVQVSAYLRGACALDSAGRVWCWGRNESGQLGRGATMPFNGLRAQRVAGLPADIVELASGSHHTCARTAAGELWCWGRNAEGQVGRGMVSATEPTPLRVTGVTAQAVRAATTGTCALTATNLVCWGNNTEGTLGLATPLGLVPTPTTVTVLPVSRPDQLRMVGGSSFVRAGDRWYGTGYRTLGGLGDGVGSRYTTYTELPALRGADVRGAGFGLVAFALRGGALEGFGYDHGGQTGTRGELARGRPARVQTMGGPLTGATALAVSENVTLLLAGGQVHTAGLNSTSQLGISSLVLTGRGTADAVMAFAEPVHALAPSGQATCAIVGTVGARRVQCFGANTVGELGRPGASSVSPVDALLPTGGGADVVDLAGGNAMVCAIVRFSDGRRVPYCWGRNDLGQLGRGFFSTTPSFDATPAPVAGDIEDAEQVVLGTGHGCIRRASGRLFCFGWNASGQVGVGSTTNVNAPTDVGLSGVAQVSASSLHTCAVTADGALHCWGSNNDGELGVGGGQRTSPTRATVLDGFGGATIHGIAVGGQHTCAILGPERALHCWGANTFGQLGGGTLGGSSATPVDTSLRGVAQVAAPRAQGGSPLRTCAVTTSGEAYCWGHCAFGWCATGEPYVVPTPTPVLLDF